MKVVIRADGSKDIGMGHIRRACLIKDMFENDFSFETILVTKENNAVKEFLSQRGIKTRFIEKDIEFDTEIALIKDMNPNFFVTDILDDELNDKYCEAFKDKDFPMTILIVDHSEFRDFDSDIIVNGNPNVEEKIDKSKYLLGPKHFLMDPAYENNIVESGGKEIKKILLTLGGTDHNDLIFKVIDAFSDLEKKYEVLIITSAATGYLDKLNSFVTENNLNCKILCDVDSLASFWGRCDVAITAGGNTLFERIASHLPGATICQLKRQMEIADSFELKGVNYNMGFGIGMDINEMRKKIDIFLNKYEIISKQRKELEQFDCGKGIRYLSERIKQIKKSMGSGLDIDNN